MASVAKSAVFVSLAGLAVSLANMGSHLVMARTFGAGAEIDAFFAGLSLPLLVGGLLSGAVGYQVVPLLMHYNGDEASAREYRNALVFSALAGGIAMGVAGAIISSVALHGFPHAESLRNHSAVFIALTGWGTASATLLTSLLVAVCHSMRHFTRPALLGLIAPLLSIVASWWAGRNGHPVLFVACALFVGQVVSALILLYRLRSEITLSVPERSALRRVLDDLRVAPLVLASMLAFTCFGTIDAYFASRLDEGAVTCLAYAQRVLVALAGLAVNGIGVVMFPVLSQSVARGDRLKTGADMALTLRLVLVVLAPVAIVAALLAEPVTRLLFGGGRFADDDVARLSGVLPYMFVGMIPMCCSAMLFKGLYAARDYTGAAVIGLAGAVVYAACCEGFGARNPNLHGFGIAYIVDWMLIAGWAGARFSQRLEIHFAPTHAALWVARMAATLVLVGLTVVLARNVIGSGTNTGRMEAAFRSSMVILLAVGTYLAGSFVCQLKDVTDFVLIAVRKVCQRNCS